MCLKKNVFSCTFNIKYGLYFYISLNVVAIPLLAGGNSGVWILVFFMQTQEKMTQTCKLALLISRHVAIFPKVF